MTDGGVPSSTQPRVPRWHTAATLASLAAGLVAGIWLHDAPAPGPSWVVAIEALGTAFLRLLQMVVLPLVFCLVVGAIAAGRRAAGAAGRRTFLVFVALLLLGAAIATTVTPLLLRFVPARSLVAGEASAIATATPEERETPPAVGVARLPEVLSRLVPDNPVRAAADGNLIQVIVFAALLGLAITSLETRRRELLLELVRGGAEALFWLVRRILLATPVVVFALALQAARTSGADAAGVLAQSVVVASLVLLAFTLALIPLGAWAARTSLGAYAAALVPVQVLGLTTRSSLAATPAVLEAALVRLRLPQRQVEVAVPLCAATFKPHGPASNTATLLFLAHVYGTPLGPVEIATFVFTTCLLSFTLVGLPDSGGGPGRTLPAYLAAGVPLEGYFLTRSVEALVDYTKTLVNVTGHLTATTLCVRTAPASGPGLKRTEPEVNRDVPAADPSSAA